MNSRQLFFYLLIAILHSVNALYADSTSKPEILPDIGLVADSSISETTGKLHPGSHVKLFLPNLPYLAISHAINASLVRPANNNKGWQYDIAISHRSIEDKIWEFDLRRNITFQNGMPFNADSILLNMQHFIKKPFTFTKLSEILERVEKVDDYKVRFYLSEPYGVFLHDAMWLQFYTPAYLEKFGWNGKPTCPNLAEPGPYALGPYILSEGYIEGDRSAKKIVLKANKNYWGDNKAKIETITIYTDLEISDARDLVLFKESALDMTPIPFSDQVATVLSPYAKLSISPSLNNYAMHFNLLNGNQSLLDERIRYVINHAIDQEYLLNLSMLGEGVLSPTMVSPNFYKVNSAINRLKSNFMSNELAHDSSIENLRHIILTYQKEKGLDTQYPLKLTVLLQESFLFLVRDIKYFLKQVNIELDLKVVDSEKKVFKQLLSTWKNNNQAWDLLLWGNYDWYKHPWSAFFVYRPGTAWSTIPNDKKLIELTDRLLATNVESKSYIHTVENLIEYVYKKNYMLFLPTPHNVYAVNKELIFTPGRSAFVYLRDLKVSSQHWSIRKQKQYPKERQRPIKINYLKLKD